MTGSLRRAADVSALVAGLALLLVLAPPALGASSTFTDQLRIDITGDVFDEGCPEPIEVSGTITSVLHITERANGTFSVVESNSAAGIRGVGLTTGAAYVGVGSTTFVGVQGVTAESYTFVDRTRLVGTAGTMTLDIRTTFHLTRVNGEIVAVHDTSSITCA